jgi:hypothetical protein
VEMVLSLSGARLKMTVLGLLKAPHTYGIASLATLPSNLGSMHETPIDAVSMVLSPRASPHWTKTHVCEVVCLDVGSPSQKAVYGMQKGLQHHTPDNCRARDGTWFGRTLGR